MSCITYSQKGTIYLALSMYKLLFSLALLIISIFHGGAVDAAPRVRLRNVFPNLVFSQPVGLEVPGGPANRFHVIEQGGVIKIFDPGAPQTATDFLDIRSKVLTGSERGLLGLAFHPGYAGNFQFYVNYTRQPDGATILARYLALPGGAAADPASEQILLTIPQPFANHNGGQLAFGRDGYLYIGLGDGGSGGDPLGNAQNRSVLLGKILRIDVNGSEGDRPYAIPANNPYKNNAEGFAQEVFAYGFRNPWRFSFDTANGRLWAADVGQNQWEEVNVVKRGGNYGWNVMEGRHCYSPPANCTTRGLIKPVAEYSRDLGIAVIGGFVYRGSRLKTFKGKYFFGDFGSGRIWTTTGRGKIAEAARLAGQISAFGRDRKKELYVVSYGGRIYALR